MFLTLIYWVIVSTDMKTIKFILAFINLIQIAFRIELFFLSWILNHFAISL
jgi:hypothetical protein